MIVHDPQIVADNKSSGVRVIKPLSTFVNAWRHLMPAGISWEPVHEQIFGLNACCGVNNGISNWTFRLAEDRVQTEFDLERYIETGDEVWEFDNSHYMK